MICFATVGTLVQLQSHITFLTHAAEHERLLRNVFECKFSTLFFLLLSSFFLTHSPYPNARMMHVFYSCTKAVDANSDGRISIAIADRIGVLLLAQISKKRERVASKTVGDSLGVAAPLWKHAADANGEVTLTEFMDAWLSIQDAQRREVYPGE